MRVLYFIPRYTSAAMGNRIHTEVIAEWRKHGVDADVITLDASAHQLTTTVEEGIAIHRLPASSGLFAKLTNRALNPILHYPYLVGALIHYRRFMRRSAYDLVHIETAFPLGLIAALAADDAHPPLAVTLPGADIMSESEFDYGYGRFLTVRLLLPFVFRRAALLRADSPQLLELAVRLGAPLDRIQAIPYNITADSYPPPGVDLIELRARSRAAVVRQHNLDPDRPIVVSLSRLHPFKGVAYMVESLPQIRQAGIRPQFVIVGPSRSTPQFGDYGDHLRQSAGELGVLDDTFLVGAVAHEQTLTYLAAADAVVVPSVAESFNRVAVEAAAVGTPVVVTNTTGVSFYIRQYQCGIAVEPRSATAIAEALSLLLSDQHLWHNFSTRAVAMADMFSSGVIAADLLQMYRFSQIEQNTT